MNVLRAHLPVSLAAVAAVLGTLLIGLYPEWEQLSQLWTYDIGSAHGWLVLGLCLFSARALLNVPTLPGIFKRAPPLLTALAFFAAVSAAHIDIAVQLTIPLIALTLTYALFAGAGVQAVRFACGYFLFALPLWAFVLAPLQHLTVFVVSHVLPWLGIAAQGQGILILIPGASFEVSEGCAGSHFLIVALAVSTLTNRSWALPPARAALSLSLAASFALLANWVRVLVIIVRAYSTDMHTSLVRDHYWFGWGVFAATLGLYFLILRRLDTGATRSAPAPAASVTVRQPRVQALCLLGLTMLALQSVHKREEGSADFGLSSLPARPALAATWAGPLYTATTWHPLFTGATDSDFATYHSPQGDVNWYRVLYAREHTGAKLIGYGNSLVPPDWRIFKQHRTATAKTAPYTSQPLWVQESEALDPQGHRHLLWSWYEWDGTPLTRPWELKLRQALTAFQWDRPHAAALEALETACEGDCAGAEALLERFARDRTSAGTP